MFNRVAGNKKLEYDILNYYISFSINYLVNVALE